MGKFKLSSSGTEEEHLKTSKFRSYDERIILEEVENDVLLETFPESEFFEASLASLHSKNTDADFNAFIVHDPLHIDVVFGDISLKGNEAIILATKIKEFLPKEDVHSTPASLPNLQSIITSIEENSFDLLRTHGAYLTLFYGRFDLEKMEFRFIDRGFTKTLIIDEIGEIYFLTSNYLPIGIDKSAESQEELVPIHQGEKWIFYTDGLITMRNNHREYFGFSRFANLMEDLKHEPIQSMQKTILSSIDQFREDQQIDGEILLMILQILPNPRKNSFISSEKTTLSSIDELKDIQFKIDSALKKDPLFKSNEKELLQLQLVTHEALSAILQVAIKQPGSNSVEFQIDSIQSGLRITFIYTGSVLDFSENSLSIIQKNVDDVRYGKNLKGHSYFEITKLFRGT